MPDLSNETTTGMYICGCDVASKREYCIHPAPLGYKGEEIMTGIRLDELGYQICPEHGSRLVGWIHIGPAVTEPKKAVKRKPLQIDFSGKDFRDTSDPATIGASYLARGNGHAQLN